jgi:poly(beta-D-mannuronate) lyase
MLSTVSISFKSNITKMATLLLLLMVFSSKTLLAETIPVSSLADLQTAVNRSQPGDVIVLADGVYTATADVVIKSRGTKAQPITITAQTIAGAEIAGNGGFFLADPASYIVIRGFKFTHASSKTKTGIGTSFCRFTQNIFENTGDGEDLTVAGSDHEIDYNTFQNKNAMGRFIAIRGKGSQIAERLHIHHNYFHDFLSQHGKNGAEAFQFGLSGFSMSSSNSIVEYNLFERCEGETELISVKASAVTVRYNTIRDCKAQFTMRHGNRSIVYGNYFFNTPGLRIFGDDHIIFSNYFENCKPAINIGNGDGEVADGSPLVCHDRPDRVLIAFNTLVNNAQNITQSMRKGGLGATTISIDNNIIQGGGSAAALSGPYVNCEWKGNILFNVKDAGNMPSTGYETIDPKLVKTASGAYHLQAGSPAIDHATGLYPDIKFDMDGQTRTQPLDIGADEVNNTPITVRILNPADVGYNSTAIGK